MFVEFEGHGAVLQAVRQGVESEERLQVTRCNWAC